ncbi:hypothetical protein BCR34DRAFT_570487 [Clohesyomyces aquaticus]|uniref:Uncharacterized protein n=1 Tax=Clohesyomyces aquaticus TaxID=1231657 RepID=A0A1Y1ZBK2_9PLEO|nr:hypothetical protein BCR34DRAFT_570487 [Clohesyomyces aquaticus]
MCRLSINTTHDSSLFPRSQLRTPTPGRIGENPCPDYPVPKPSAKQPPSRLDHERHRNQILPKDWCRVSASTGSPRDPSRYTSHTQRVR